MPRQLRPGAFDLASKLTRKHESLRLKMYKDTVGKWTIGWGRNIEDRGLTKKEADFLHDTDMEVAIDTLDKLVPWWRTLDGVRQAALIDMSYNMGYDSLKTFEKGTLPAIQRRDFAAAAANLRRSKWAAQTKTRAVRIIAMIETGKPPADV